MADEVSIAIETSCRAGGIALGCGDKLADLIEFDTSTRHAAQLVCRLEEMLTNAKLQPGDLDHAYVSVGPGSFTGLRIGITVVRTMAQMLQNLQCVAVPTPAAVAENVRSLDWQHLGVIMDAREGQLYAAGFARLDGDTVPAAGTPAVMTAEKFLSSSPRPLMLTGEGLGYHHLPGDGIELADAETHLPTPEGVWRVGRRLARAGQFIDYHQLLPIYTRRPEALRLQERQAAEGKRTHGPEG